MKCPICYGRGKGCMLCEDQGRIALWKVVVLALFLAYIGFVIAAGLVILFEWK